MLIYNIKTQVKFDFGYNPLIFYGVMGLFKMIAHLAGASVSYGHISSFKYLHNINVGHLNHFVDADVAVQNSTEKG